MKPTKSNLALPMKQPTLAGSSGFRLAKSSVISGAACFSHGASRPRFFETLGWHHLFAVVV